MFPLDPWNKFVHYINRSNDNSLFENDIEKTLFECKKYLDPSQIPLVVKTLSECEKKIEPSQIPIVDKILSEHFQFPQSPSLKLFNASIKFGIYSEDYQPLDGWKEPLPPLGATELVKLKFILTTFKILPAILQIVPDLKVMGINLTASLSFIGEELYSFLGKEYLIKAYKEIADKLKISTSLEPCDITTNSIEIPVIHFCLPKIRRERVISFAKSFEAKLRKLTTEVCDFTYSEYNLGEAPKVCRLIIKKNNTTLNIDFANDDFKEENKDILALPLSINDILAFENKCFSNSNSYPKDLKIVPTGTRNSGASALLFPFLKRQMPLNKEIQFEDAIKSLIAISRGELGLSLKKPISQTFYSLWRIDPYTPDLEPNNFNFDDELAIKSFQADLLTENASEMLLEMLLADSPASVMGAIQKQIEKEFPDQPLALLSVQFNLCTLLHRYHSANPRRDELEKIIRMKIASPISKVSIKNPARYIDPLQTLLSDCSIPFNVISALFYLNGFFLQSRADTFEQISPISFFRDVEGISDVAVMQWYRGGPFFLLLDDFLASLDKIASYVDGDGDGGSAVKQWTLLFQPFFEGVPINFQYKKGMLEGCKIKKERINGIVEKANKLLSNKTTQLIGFQLLCECVRLCGDDDNFTIIVKHFFESFKGDSSAIKLVYIQQFLTVISVLNPKDCLLDTVTANSMIKKFALSSVLEDDYLSTCLPFFAYSNYPKLSKVLLEILKEHPEKLRAIAPEMIKRYTSIEPKGTLLALKIFEQLLTSKKAAFGELEKSLTLIFNAYPSAANLIGEIDTLSGHAQKALLLFPSEKLTHNSIYAKICSQIIESYPNLGKSFLELSCSRGLFNEKPEVIFEQRNKLFKYLSQKCLWDELLSNFENGFGVAFKQDFELLLSQLLSVDYQKLSSPHQQRYRDLLLRCCVQNFKDEMSFKFLTRLADSLICLENVDGNKSDWITSLQPIGKWLLKQLSLHPNSETYKAYLNFTKNLKIKLEDESIENDNTNSVLGACAFIHFINSRKDLTSSSKIPFESLIVGVASQVLESVNLDLQLCGFQLLCFAVVNSRDIQKAAPLINSLPVMMTSDISIEKKRELISYLSKYFNNWQDKYELTHIEAFFSKLSNELWTLSSDQHFLLHLLCINFSDFQHDAVIDEIYGFWSKLSNDGSTYTSPTGLFLSDKYRKQHPKVSFAILEQMVLKKCAPFEKLSGELNLLFDRFLQNDLHSLENTDSLFKLTLQFKLRYSEIDSAQRQVLAVLIFRFVDHFFDSDPKRCLEALNPAKLIAPPTDFSAYAEDLLEEYRLKHKIQPSLIEFPLIKIIEQWILTNANQEFKSNSRSLSLFNWSIKQLIENDIELAQKLLDDALNKELVYLGQKDIVGLHTKISEKLFEAKFHKKAIDSCGYLITNNYSIYASEQLEAWSYTPGQKLEQYHLDVFEKVLLAYESSLMPYIGLFLANCVNDILGIKDLKLPSELNTLLTSKAEILAAKICSDKLKFAALLNGLAKHGNNIVELLEKGSLWDQLSLDVKDPSLNSILSQNSPGKVVDSKNRGIYFLSQIKFLLDENTNDKFECLSRAFKALGGASIPENFQEDVFKCIELKIDQKGAKSALELLPSIRSLPDNKQAILWNASFLDHNLPSDIAAKTLIDNVIFLRSLKRHDFNYDTFANSFIGILLFKGDEESLSFALQLKELLGHIPVDFWKLLMEKGSGYKKVRNTIISRLSAPQTEMCGTKKEIADCWFSLIKIMERQNKHDFGSLIGRQNVILNLLDEPKKNEALNILLIGFIKVLSKNTLDKTSLQSIISVVDDLKKARIAVDDNVDDHELNLQIIENLLKQNSYFRFISGLDRFKSWYSKSPADYSERAETCVNFLFEYYLTNHREVDFLTASEFKEFVGKAELIFSSTSNQLNYINYHLLDPSEAIIKTAYPIAKEMVKVSGNPINDEMTFPTLLTRLIEHKKDRELLNLLLAPGINNVYSKNVIFKIISDLLQLRFEILKLGSPPEDILAVLEFYCTARQFLINNKEKDAELRKTFLSFVFALPKKLKSTYEFRHLLGLDFQIMLTQCSKENIETWEAKNKKAQTNLLSILTTNKDSENIKFETGASRFKLHIPKELYCEIDATFQKFSLPEIVKNRSPQFVNFKDRLIKLIVPNEITIAHPEVHAWFGEILLRTIDCEIIDQDTNASMFLFISSMMFQLIELNFEPEIIINLIFSFYSRYNLNDSELIIKQDRLSSYIYHAYILKLHGNLTRVSKQTICQAGIIFKFNNAFIFDPISDALKSSAISQLLKRLLQHNEHMRIFEALSIFDSNIDNICGNISFFKSQLDDLIFKTFKILKCVNIMKDQIDELPPIQLGKILTDENLDKIVFSNAQFIEVFDALDKMSSKINNIISHLAGIYSHEDRISDHEENLMEECFDLCLNLYRQLVLDATNPYSERWMIKRLINFVASIDRTSNTWGPLNKCIDGLAKLFIKISSPNCPVISDYLNEIFEKYPHKKTKWIKMVEHQMLLRIGYLAGIEEVGSDRRKQ